jgi:hypothetical protein
LASIDPSDNDVTPVAAATPPPTRNRRRELRPHQALSGGIRNTGGQVFEPPRGDDPGTDGRRSSSGYIGLRVHSTTDAVSYRDIRIKKL